MKKSNVVLTILLVFGFGVFILSMQLVIIPQMDLSTQTEISEQLKDIEERLTKDIDQYTVKDEMYNSIVSHNLQKTREIEKKAKEITGLK